MTSRGHPPPGCEGHHVRLPRLHSCLGQVAQRGQRGPTGHGQGPTGLVPSSITDARALHHRHSRSKLLPLNPRELNGSRARRGVRASDAAEVRLIPNPDDGNPSQANPASFILEPPTPSWFPWVPIIETWYEPSSNPHSPVRPDGAYHRWRRVPPGELSIAPVADERFGRATDWAGAS